VTSNGCEDWSFGNHQKVNRLNDVFFINTSVGWAVGSYDDLNLNCCLYTEDGGATWFQQSSMSIAGAELNGVHFRDENQGQACGADGAFFITNNGGTTSWGMGIAMPLVNLNDIFNFGMLNGCIVGNNGTLLYTINNWYQFIEQNSNTSENLNGVSGYAATNELWAVGNNGTIIYSSNYLLGWMTQASGVTENLNDICMVSSIEGWAVGDNGTILHFTGPVGHRDIREGSEIIVNNNLANNRVAISFPDNTFVNFIQVHALTDEIVYYNRMNRLCNYYEFDLSDVDGGLYVLNIDTNIGSKSKKIFFH
jgi:photosystem II stability/assembly factor-like uncharacterized protein